MSTLYYGDNLMLPRQSILRGRWSAALVFATMIMPLEMAAADNQTSFIQSVAATPSIDDMNKRLDEQFSDMRKAMPTQVSTLSKLINVQRAGTILNYTYEDKIPADKWTGADKRKLVADITKTQCDDKNTRSLMEMGYSFGALHIDESRRFIAHVFIDKSKCN